MGLLVFDEEVVVEEDLLVEAGVVVEDVVTVLGRMKRFPCIVDL